MLPLSVASFPLPDASAQILPFHDIAVYQAARPVIFTGDMEGGEGGSGGGEGGRGGGKGGTGGAGGAGANPYCEMKYELTEFTSVIVSVRLNTMSSAMPHSERWSLLGGLMEKRRCS